MKQNVGGADRVVRLLIAVVIGVLYFMGKIGGTLAIVLEVVAVAMLVTSLVGWCPIYAPFKISTRKQST